MKHATRSDTFPSEDGRTGVARSVCLVCPWFHEAPWSGPQDPYEFLALMVTQGRAEAHEASPDLIKSTQTE